MNRLAKSVPKKNGQRKTLSIQKLKLVQRYFDLAKLYLEGNQKKNLLMDVKAFEVASLAGNYYQSFAVNSKNYQEKSGGTRTWIAECDRLLDRCVAQAIKGNAAYAQQIFTALSLPLKLLIFRTCLFFIEPRKLLPRGFVQNCLASGLFLSYCAGKAPIWR